MPNHPKTPAANQNVREQGEPQFAPRDFASYNVREQGEQRFAPTEYASYIINVELDPAYTVSALPGSAGLAGDEDYFADAVRYVLAAEGATAPLELGLRIIGDAEIQELHRRFFGLDRPTDVIAFGQQEQNLAAIAQPFITNRQEPAGPLYWQHEDIQLPAPTTQGERQFAPTTQNFVVPPLEIPYLGDIVASFETAAAQAADYGHTALEELTELVMHGTLHLLGYDDHDPGGYQLMHSHEDAYVAAFLAAARKEQADA